MNDLTTTKAKAAVSAVENKSIGVYRNPPQAEQEKQSDMVKVDFNESDLNTAVEELQNFASLNDVNLNFSVDKTTGRTIIKVVDATTNEVVRQLPPEELLALAKTMDDLAGVLLNIRA